MPYFIDKIVEIVSTAPAAPSKSLSSLSNLSSYYKRAQNVFNRFDSARSPSGVEVPCMLTPTSVGFNQRLSNNLALHFSP
jgi:hypothetical protein